MQESGSRASASVALTLAWVRVRYNFKDGVVGRDRWARR